jgi:hypothetical protein
LVEVCVEGVDDGLGEGDGSSRCRCLGFGLCHEAADFGERSGDGDAAPLEVEVAGLE